MSCHIKFEAAPVANSELNRELPEIMRAPAQAVMQLMRVVADKSCGEIWQNRDKPVTAQIFGRTPATTEDPHVHQELVHESQN